MLTTDSTTEVRWIGVTPPSRDVLDAIEYVENWDARALADAVIDGGQTEVDLEWLGERYRRARDTRRRLTSIHEAMWASGRFAGWIVRDGELAAADPTVS